MANTVRAVKFEVNYEGQIAYIEETAPNSWAVKTDGGFTLSKSQRGFNFESVDSALNANWLQDHRWKTSQLALDAYYNSVDFILSGGT